MKKVDDDFVNEGSTSQLLLLTFLFSTDNKVFTEGLMQLVDIDIDDHFYLSTVTEISEKCEAIASSKGSYRNVIREFRAYLKHISEVLKIHNLFLIVYLEMNQVMMNCSRGPKLLHVTF
ncbi:hypothetical protein Tco_0272588 [Tanacetum coccineum]